MLHSEWRHDVLYSVFFGDDGVCGVVRFVLYIMFVCDAETYGFSGACCGCYVFYLNSRNLKYVPCVYSFRRVGAFINT